MIFVHFSGYHCAFDTFCWSGNAIKNTTRFHEMWKFKSVFVPSVDRCQQSDRCAALVTCVACQMGVFHYNDVIMSATAFQITSLTTVYSTDHSGTDQRKHQISASLAFVRRIHWWSVNSPYIGSVTRKMLPFDDVIMWISCCQSK